MSKETDALIEEARMHAWAVGPNMGICAADGIFDQPIGAVLADECRLVQELATALEHESKMRQLNAEAAADAVKIARELRDENTALAEKVAAAWDEGVEARSEDAIIRRSPQETLARNPYRILSDEGTEQ